MITWRKSSHSNAVEDSTCVEVAALPLRTAEAMAVRDSKDPDGPRLHLRASAWSALLAYLKTSRP
ncbi:DUF397 domain-containing protein [Actinomadura kijaniata]|uniref:DUF397 domain-containing protein n=1 Tax=Actinomadura kijaniata TaxID=46161 RepID=UPI001603C158|nr:DUF397 domain-containing protein [Actinomadura namibiensis]